MNVVQTLYRNELLASVPFFAGVPCDALATSSDIASNSAHIQRAFVIVMAISLGDTEVSKATLHSRCIEFALEERDISEDAALTLHSHEVLF